MDAFPDTATISDVQASSIELRLKVRDPEVVAELLRRPEGLEREAYALGALRLGVLAIRQAGGALDSAAIQREAERMLAEVDKLVSGNANTLKSQIESALKEYFDPGSGKLTERLDRLVRKDGELTTLLAQNLEGDSCRLAQTLARHVGLQSPLFQMLSPTQKDGLVSRLTDVVELSLRGQRDQILRQFSLDDSASALSRLVKNVTDGNGRLREELAKDLTTVRREFSLDNPEGALSRLVGRVEAAQRAISNEFSKDNENSMMSKLSSLLEKTHTTVEAKLTLDKEDSPLSRLSRELKQLIGDLSKSSVDFQKEVRETLGAIQGRREEAVRGTHHGLEFEALVGEVLAVDARQAGDSFEPVGNVPGRIPRSKVGDLVITIGAESKAAGARIVVECKEKAGYTEADAVREIDEARRNRDARVGIFVFSQQTAPAGLPPIHRVAGDVLCVWDKDDQRSDVYLQCALSLARALAVRERLAAEQVKIDVSEIDAAVTRIERDSKHLAEVLTWAGNIARDSEKILKCVTPLQGDLEIQLKRLREALAELKADSAPSAAGP